MDRFTDGLLTSSETSSYLRIPHSTPSTWLKGRAAGAPLVHRVERGPDRLHVAMTAETAWWPGAVTSA